MFTNLPYSIVLYILEFVGAQLVNDCKSLDQRGTPQFGEKLKQYRRLLLVNKTFSILLSSRVRVDGQLLRNKLLDMQEENFIHLIGSSTIPLDSYQSDLWLNEYNTSSSCGPIRKSPRLYNVLHLLFYFYEHVNKDYLLTFFYFIPRTLKNRLSLIPNIPVETQGTLKEPSVVGEEYRWDFKFNSLNFTLGKYRLGPFEARVRRRGHRLNPLSTTWTGVSITSFNTYWGQGETDSDDFMYWLWYHRAQGRIWNYYIVDYKSGRINDSYDWYIGRTGRGIRKRPRQ